MASTMASATVSALLLLASLAAAGRCPSSSWTNVGDKCYWVSDSPVAWDNIADRCSSVFGTATPVAIHDLTTHANLASFLAGKRAWLGLSRADRKSSWAWADGSPVDFLAWDEDQPTNQKCAIINHDSTTGLWGSAGCSGTKHAVCEMPALVGCPEGWTTDYQGRCYFFANGVYNNTSWQEAEEDCYQRGPWARQPSVHSAEEGAFLASLTGGYQAWLGLRRHEDSTWRWSDDTPLDYVNWYSGQPHDGDDCAVFGYDGSFVGKHCVPPQSSPRESGFPYVCQMDS